MKAIEVISGNIRKNLSLGKAKHYVIEGEVHVTKGVTLTIADGATLLIVNGVFPKSQLRRSALIFDQGSVLQAKRFQVKAAGANHRPVRFADNGGIWFLGNYADARTDNDDRDGLAVKVNRKNPLSRFTAQTISTSYLGRKDSYVSTKTGKQLDIGDDLDGFSLLGVGPTEWNVSTVRVAHSADDGFDLTNSNIRLDRLEVKAPTEDALNLCSSRLEVRRSLALDVTKTGYTDRDIFDFETDDGPAMLVLYKNCWVRVKGVFGDELVMSSKDMPTPYTASNNERKYEFSGRLKKSAMIYSIERD